MRVLDTHIYIQAVKFGGKEKEICAFYSIWPENMYTK